MERMVVFLVLISEVFKGETDTQASFKYFFFPTSFCLYSRKF